jgi:hypothetical protein
VTAPLVHSTQIAIERNVCDEHPTAPCRLTLAMLGLRFSCDAVLFTFTCSVCGAKIDVPFHEMQFGIARVQRDPPPRPSLRVVK